MTIKIAMIGAGSIGFTRRLMHDPGNYSDGSGKSRKNGITSKGAIKGRQERNALFSQR
jgi:hypothetical protein